MVVTKWLLHTKFATIDLVNTKLKEKRIEIVDVFIYLPNKIIYNEFYNRFYIFCVELIHCINALCICLYFKFFINVTI